MRTLLALAGLGVQYLVWPGRQTLKKIDCIMVEVEDLESARDFYVRVLGMRQVWSDEAEGSIGFQFPDGDAEIVQDRIASIPANFDVTFLVDEVSRAVQRFKREGCTLVAAPFDGVVGKWAVVVDSFGTPLRVTAQIPAEEAGGL